MIRALTSSVEPETYNVRPEDAVEGWCGGWLEELAADGLTARGRPFPDARLWTNGLWYRVRSQSRRGTARGREYAKDTRRLNLGGHRLAELRNYIEHHLVELLAGVGPAIDRFRAGGPT